MKTCTDSHTWGCIGVSKYLLRLCLKNILTSSVQASAGLPQYVAEAPVYVAEAPGNVAEAPGYVAEVPPDK